MDALQEKILNIVDEDIAEECCKLGDFPLGLPLNMHIARYLKRLATILSTKESKDGKDCSDGGS